MPIDPETWPRTPREAVVVQQALRGEVRLDEAPEAVRTIAGIDVAYDPATDRAFAVALLLDAASLAPVAHRTAWMPVTFPYVPGFLSFREVPAVMAAIDRLPRSPDLLMVDGQGVAHPRRFGIACHLGVLTGLPAIGVAKSRLCGAHGSLGEARGEHVPLTDKGERIGTVLRSRTGCNPLFVSPGHRMTQDAALDWAMRTLGRYRLPEPTRLADRISKEKEGKETLL